MSLKTVTQKYAVDTHRTKAVWVATALFALVFGFMGWSSALDWEGQVRPLTTGGLQSAAAFLVPLVCIALGHGAIAADRESGALRVLLAQPHSRRDVVGGAFVGRLVAIGAALLVGLVVSLVAYSVRAGQLPGSESLTLAGFVLLWTLFGVSLTIAVSALVSTGRRAVAGGIGAYLFFALLWDWVPQELYRRTATADMRYQYPEWVSVLTNLDPVTAFSAATRLLVYRPDRALAVYETIPFYAVSLLCWAVVPIALALWRFPKADL
jgi:ABC-2 type transport system permease protein